MRRLCIFWCLHWFATVSGWYSLGALAQGAVDSDASAPFSLVILNGIIHVLCFPLVTPAIWAWPALGGFRLGSFAAFAALAAINSAVVIAIITAAIRAARGRNAGQT